MTCAIIEDDRHTVSMLTAIINECFENITIIGNAPSVIKGLTLINNNKPDLVLLDVHLKDGESFEILDGIDNVTSKIIFITSHTVGAEKALHYNGVIGFIKKPFETKDIFKIITRAINQIQLEKNSTTNTNELSKKITLNIKTNDTNESVFIPLKDVIYVESDNNKSFVCTCNNDRIKANKTLKQFTSDFPERYFFRTHQSFLVNLKYVKKFDNDTYEAILNNDIYIPVSQSKKIDFIKALEKIV